MYGAICIFKQIKYLRQLIDYKRFSIDVYHRLVYCFVRKSFFLL